MTGAGTTYHQRIAQEKRALILTAANALFLELGYDRTSLARIAERSGVSRATLFKQFPSKAALFDAMVTESWSTASEEDTPPAGDIIDGLSTIGRRYAELLRRPRMTDLFRIVISELPRFPELADAQFAHGKMPYFESVRTYLLAEHEAGTVRVEDVELAATQFLGMISNYVFWPTLLVPGWEVSAERVAEVVDEAVRTTVARYATTGSGTTTHD
ncbi:TetR/AcrR family transcriptional regulator [Gordonia amicalis]|uniref:TetR/AcrR family transcriptional regulator n=1 Tax=Gordonia amicalis TaxID=89053 RepID=UPI0002A65B42|nr:TetR/AcrR family transcriptional regulator [Gordonia amicalis]MBA5849685.1 TetR/AcrR family transcriptional regulator [Gordonia amicalis]MDV7173846.1 TetR/AcrR family transcriptional regulator [Gordonia amicalis]NKX76783.1 TetR/AcrR family transcriptional regulator [Gordonia amicalis]UKO90838.1 TetR/AcrR family transcriptional regulator [Gordonia amicalis]UOG22349.1 TetR/AcrR family transcriptional regulator [Gordonia amicalis]